MSFAIAEISALFEVNADTFVFGKELPLRINDKSVSKCSAVLALPPFPMIQIDFCLFRQSKIQTEAELRSLCEMGSKLPKYSKYGIEFKKASNSLVAFDSP
jgi:hypothetical protein